MQMPVLPPGINLKKKNLNTGKEYKSIVVGFLVSKKSF